LRDRRFAHDRSIEPALHDNRKDRSSPMKVHLQYVMFALSLAAGVAFAPPAGAGQAPASDVTGNSPEANSSMGDDSGAPDSNVGGRRIDLIHGEVQVLDIANVVRVAVGAGDVLKASVVASNQVVLIGQQAGTTSLRVWTRSGAQFNYQVKVRSFDTAQILRDVQDLLAGEPGISARQVDGHVLIEGDYTAAKSAPKIAALLKIYPQIVSTVPVNEKALPVHVERMVYMGPGKRSAGGREL
jgi:hypothetical protein